MKHGEFKRHLKRVRKMKPKEIARLITTEDFNDEQDQRIFDAIPPEKVSEVVRYIK